MSTSRLVFKLAETGRLVRVRDSSELAALPVSVEGLSCERLPIADSELVALPVLSHVRCLDLDGTRVTDAALAWVSKLPQLEELWLEETGVTDQGIQLLRSNRKLQFLSVAYTMVTPAGIEALQAHINGLEVSP